MKLILGSQSVDRGRVLASLGLVFDVVKPNIDEKAIRDTDPTKLTLALAHAKADKLLSEINKEAILITADQVVYCNGEIIEKPESADEVRERCREYGRFPVSTVTSLVVTDASTKKRKEGTDVATVWFKPLPDTLVEQFIADPLTYTRAGGFTIEDERLQPYIERIEGTIDSIIGMPKGLVVKLLTEFGYNV